MGFQSRYLLILVMEMTMESKTWKKGVASALVAAGFRRQGPVFIFDGAEVLLICDLQYAWARWFINVGFWLKSIRGEVPSKVEKTHLYFRLESVFPEHLDVITMAGDISNARCARAHEKLLDLIRGDIGPRLRKMGALDELRAAYRKTLRDNGLLWKKVRPILED